VKIGREKREYGDIAGGKPAQEDILGKAQGLGLRENLRIGEGLEGAQLKRERRTKSFKKN